ncbi:hypothetical protein N431DRAFT_323469 [Stipitochalara longipes BDJ]|nr:hypothetical protein N431DRAFT_323469 [Stipitochalara longipes BDJ]
MSGFEAPPKPSVILRVIDIGFESNMEPIITLECLWKRRLRPCLKALPPQAPGTARVFICGFALSEKSGAAGSTVLSHMKERGVANFGMPVDSDISNLSKLACQWQDTGRVACLGIKFLLSSLTYYTQCVPLEGNKLIGIYIGSILSVSALLMSVSLFKVVHSVRGVPSSYLMNKLNKSLPALNRSRPIFRLMRLGGSRTDFSKLVLLNVLNLALGDALIQLDHKAGSIQEEYETNGYQGLRYAAVEKYNDESSRYKTLVDEAQDLVEMMELVVSSIKKSESEKRPRSEHPNGSLEDVSDASKTLETFLEGIHLDCRQLKKHAARIQAYDERRYKLYINALNIHESYSVRRLTSLATVFLPLSLAASMLGMQTRFVKLKLLLYDFVGVGLLLAVLMYTIYLMLKLASGKWRWRPFQQTSFFFRVWNKTLFLLLGFWLAGSFAAGMLRSASFGRYVFGISGAVLFGIIILVPIVVLLNDWKSKLNERR